jgi:hypothetical protein
MNQPGSLKKLKELTDRVFSEVKADGCEELLYRDGSDHEREAVDHKCVREIFHAMLENREADSDPRDVFVEAELLYREVCIRKGCQQPVVYLPSTFPDQIREFFLETPVRFCEDPVLFEKAYHDFTEMTGIPFNEVPLS